jgi:hypothetical protein
MTGPAAMPCGETCNGSGVADVLANAAFGFTRSGLPVGAFDVLRLDAVAGPGGGGLAGACTLEPSLGYVVEISDSN